MTAIGTVPAPVTGDDPLGLADLGRQVRETRRSLNMSQLALGRELGYSQSSVARIEAGEKPLTPEGRRAVLAGIAALGSDGHVPWFGPWLHAERTATALRSWEGPLIPGLAQTRAYARHVLRTASPGISAAELDAHVAARMARQDIWQRTSPGPPVFAAIISEWALRQAVGTPEIMREQLHRLLALASRHGVSIHVLPLTAGDSAGVLAPFVVASFAPGPRPDAAYLDDAVEGRTIGKRDVVEKLKLIYDGLAGDAHSRCESRELIGRAIGEWT